MGQQYLIDSNTVIDYMTRKLTEKGMNFMRPVLNDIPKLSVITMIVIQGEFNYVYQKVYQIKNHPKKIIFKWFIFQ